MIDPLAKLTPSNRKVLHLVGACYNNKAICDRLHLSKKSVEKHLMAIRNTLGIEVQGSGSEFATRCLMVRAADALIHLEQREREAQEMPDDSDKILRFTKTGA